MKVPTTDIIVGDRIRKDIDKDIGPLCESMRRLGQLQPCLVDSDLNLIAGARRLRACELLGIDVDIVMVTRFSDAVSLLLAERDENTCRKDFTPSEAVEIGRRIEALEAPKAAERKSAGTNQHSEPASESDEASKGRTDAKVAATVGMGKDKYRAAKVVVEHGSPELIEAMDSGAVSVSAAAKAATLPDEQQAQVVEAAKESKAAASKAAKSFPPSNVGALAASSDDEIVDDEKPQTIKRKGKGIDCANEAINHLFRIPKNDALRGRGLQIVRAWLKTHGGPRPVRQAGKSDVINAEYTIEAKITRLLNHVKKSNEEAVDRLPNLSNELRKLAVRLEEFADEVDAKAGAAK